MAQVRAGDARALEIHAEEVGPGEIRAGEVRARQGRAREVRPGRDGSGEVGEAEIRAVEAGSGQLRARQVGRGQVGAGEGRAGQIGPGQVGVPQVLAGEVPAGQVGPRADGPRVLRSDLAARSHGRRPRCERRGGEACRHDGEGERDAESAHGGEAYPAPPGGRKARSTTFGPCRRTCLTSPVCEIVSRSLAGRSRRCYDETLTAPAGIVETGRDWMHRFRWPTGIAVLAIVAAFGILSTSASSTA